MKREIVHAHGLETVNDTPIRSVLALLAKLKLPIHKTELDLSVPMRTLTRNVVHSLPFTVVPRLSELHLPWPIEVLAR